MTDWREIKVIPSPDRRRRLVLQEGLTGLFRYEDQRWQRYYEPSPDDDSADVRGGLWGGTTSGLFDSAEAAEDHARTSVEWLSQF